MANKFSMMRAINKLYWLVSRLLPVLGTALPAVFRNAPFAVARGLFSIRLAEIGAFEALYAPSPKHAWIVAKFHLSLLAHAPAELLTVWEQVRLRF